ncbi:unnamed protein product [Ilex paraguariensis]|uniref:Cytokinin riboside 5'-monophosphate phosphoribohydrolase n=1 Tax=Ilex paraguariensis TaxID=185542 RepID=A0ABC8UIH8_9AQUA
MEDHHETKSRFKRICVFCGSSSGKKASYQEAAVELGKELVERRIDLVYGGGSVGLMGLISQAVHDGGRHVLGGHASLPNIYERGFSKSQRTTSWDQMLAPDDESVSAFLFLGDTERSFYGQQLVFRSEKT